MQIEIQNDMARDKERRIQSNVTTATIYVPQSALKGLEVELEVMLVEDNQQIVLRGVTNGLNIVDVSAVKPADFKIETLITGDTRNVSANTQWCNLKIKKVAVLVATMAITRIIVE